MISLLSLLRPSYNPNHEQEIQRFSSEQITDCPRCSGPYLVHSPIVQVASCCVRCSFNSETDCPSCKKSNVITTPKRCTECNHVEDTLEEFDWDFNTFEMQEQEPEVDIHKFYQIVDLQHQRVQAMIHQQEKKEIRDKKTKTEKKEERLEDVALKYFNYLVPRALNGQSFEYLINACMEQFKMYEQYHQKKAMEYNTKKFGAAEIEWIVEPKRKKITIQRKKKKQKTECCPKEEEDADTATHGKKWKAEDAAARRQLSSSEEEEEEELPPEVIANLPTRKNKKNPFILRNRIPELTTACFYVVLERYGISDWPQYTKESLWEFCWMGKYKASHQYLNYITQLAQLNSITVDSPENQIKKAYNRLLQLLQITSIEKERTDQQLKYTLKQYTEKKLKGKTDAIAAAIFYVAFKHFPRTEGIPIKFNQLAKFVNQTENVISQCVKNMKSISAVVV